MMFGLNWYIVSLYKGKRFNPLSQLCITIKGKPSVDTGGVRRQVYSKLYQQFCSNHFIHMFEGPANRLCPACTAEVRSSGLLKILGTMVAHSTSGWYRISLIYLSTATGTWLQGKKRDWNLPLLKMYQLMLLMLSGRYVYMRMHMFKFYLYQHKLYFVRFGLKDLPL